MKIREVKLNKFKRFTDLTITGIPQTAKLVILVGPNGCGKTSVFEAFNHWYKWRGFNTVGNKDYYFKESDREAKDDGNWFSNQVQISTYDTDLSNRDNIHGTLYFRTAHRNEPDFTTSNLSRQGNPKDSIKFDTLMSTDMSVSENYQRLVSNALAEVFNSENDSKLVKDLREKLIGKVKKSLNNVFDDLQLASIGDPLANGSFYFTKGRSENFHYKNLSAGEKSAFDLILDLVIKATYFENTVYCIDEPEAHMHTALQSKLLSELYNLISDNSQLWLSTHSIGMLKAAKELEKLHPKTVCFLNFTDMDFDTSVVIRPSTIDATIWNKFLELAFGDFAKLIAPQRVVFCEGTVQGRAYKNFDAQIYGRIFSSKYPDTSFVSIGSCSELEDENNISMKIISQVLRNSTIIKFVDRDDKSDEEVQELKAKGIKVLNKRHLECYLLDDEIIIKLCRMLGKEEKTEDCITAKQQAISESVSRSNPLDDIKSASGKIYTELKRILCLTKCGNKKDAFLRDTIAPLITEETQIYKDLESEIFGNIS
jgi:predicted ATPase